MELTPTIKMALIVGVALLALVFAFRSCSGIDAEGELPPRGIVK
jgi:hypothetical protein